MIECYDKSRYSSMASVGIVTVGNHLYYHNSNEIVEVVKVSSSKRISIKKKNGEVLNVVRDELIGISINADVLKDLGFVCHSGVWVKDRVKIRAMHNSHWVQVFNTIGVLLVCGYADYVHQLENIQRVVLGIKF